MALKYFILCFLICAINAQTTEHSSDFLNILRGTWKEIVDGMEEAGTAVARSVKKAGTAVADEYRKVERTVEDDYKVLRKSYQEACACSNYNCGCCAHLEEPHIELNATICTNITYLVHDYGISFTVTVNGYAIYNETVSARNPPPVCLGVPYVKELADVCVRLYDINATTSFLHACVKVEARMRTVLIAQYDLGCFNIGSRSLTFYGVKMPAEHTEPTVAVETTPEIEDLQTVVVLTTDSDHEVEMVRLQQVHALTLSTMLVGLVVCLAALMMITVATLIVYTGIKKRRDGHRAMLNKMKKGYGSTTSLVSHMDPYC